MAQPSRPWPCVRGGHGNSKEAFCSQTLCFVVFLHASSTARLYITLFASLPQNMHTHRYVFGVRISSHPLGNSSDISCFMTFMTSQMWVKSPCMCWYYSMKFIAAVSDSIIIASSPDCELCGSRNRFCHVHYYIPSARNSAWKIVRVDWWMHRRIDDLTYCLGLFLSWDKNGCVVQRRGFQPWSEEKKEVGYNHSDGSFHFFRDLIFLTGV